MKTFEILFSGLSSGTIVIKANSREEAEEIFDDLSDQALKDATDETSYIIESIS